MKLRAAARVLAIVVATLATRKAVGGSAESTLLLDGGATSEFKSKSQIVEAAHIAMAVDATQSSERASIFSEAEFSRKLRDWMSGLGAAVSE